MTLPIGDPKITADNIRNVVVDGIRTFHLANAGLCACKRAKNVSLVDCIIDSFYSAGILNPPPALERALRKILEPPK